MDVSLPILLVGPVPGIFEDVILPLYSVFFGSEMQIPHLNVCEKQKNKPETCMFQIIDLLFDPKT